MTNSFPCCFLSQNFQNLKIVSIQAVNLLKTRGTMNNILLVILVVFGILAITASILFKGKRQSERVRKIELMTKNELEFWKILRRAAAPLNVGPQVAMSALIDAEKGLSKSDRTTIRNRFDRQRVDFILFDNQGEVKLLVELDDASHRAEQDARRDERTSIAGYKTLRVRRKDAPNDVVLRDCIAAAINPAPVASVALTS